MRLARCRPHHASARSRELLPVAPRRARRSASFGSVRLDIFDDLVLGSTHRDRPWRRSTKFAYRRDTMDLGANVRKLMLGALAISSWLLASGAVPCAAQDSKPNIVMLMTDDTGWGDFGAYGGGASLGHPTPNVDRVAREGAVFTSWYGQASLHRRPRLVHDRTHPDPLGPIGRGGSG